MIAKEDGIKYLNYFDEEDVQSDIKQKQSRKRAWPSIDTYWDRAIVFVKFLKIFMI